MLPSFSIGESLLSHYSSRLFALEHRFLVCVFLLRIEAARVVFVCSREPDPEVVDLYLSLLPDSARADARGRLNIVVVDDSGPRAVAQKLLDRPDLLEEIGSWIGDEPAYIEPWNVAEPEQELAVRLGLPLFGTPPELWPIGFKSAGRALFAEADVAMPAGIENLATVTDAVDAIDRLRVAQPDMRAVILKHDDSGAGDGNAVIRVGDLESSGSELAKHRLRSRINSLEPWYVNELRLGFVAEERIVGDRFTSPSAQVEIRPDGAVTVLSTHEQVLGGPDEQVYMGCRFPADPAYAAEIGGRAEAVAKVLAERGALGRAGVDFVAASTDGGLWSTYAIEVNLRKSGTTHPYSVLRHLAPGRYDTMTGVYTDDLGQVKCYVASDNLVDESWTGLAVRDVIQALKQSGLIFDPSRRTGVVPHMLGCLGIDGRFGVAAIGNDREQADEFFESTSEAIHRLATDRAAFDA